MGDPVDPDTQLGPLATESIRDDLHRQVEDSVRAGARLLLGGTLPEGDGWFYPPTVLADIPRDAPAWGEELFGPVASLFRVPDIDAAIRLANDSDFGLGSAAWTQDPAEQDCFIRELEAGMVCINEDGGGGRLTSCGAAWPGQVGWGCGLLNFGWGHGG